MNILNSNIKEYLDKLCTKNPTPGGGSVAGLTASQGIALNLMVINITLSNKKYEQYFSLNEEIKEECERLYEKLILTADSDVMAFDKLAKAYSMPKETEEEKTLKNKVLEEASKGATQAPFEVIKLSADGIRLTEKLLGKSSKMAISDLGVAAELFKSASKSAFLNVKINLPYLPKELAQEFYEKSRQLCMHIEELSGKIFDEVEKSI